jgi:cobalt-zinc-cadmium efflux system outer membrane protein
MHPSRPLVSIALAALVSLASARALAELPAAPETAPSAAVPSLARVITLARERAPAAAAAREEVNVGRAEQVGARLSPMTNPYIEVIAQRGTQGATKDVAVQGSLWLPVEVSGQRERRIAEADALLALRESELESTRAQVVGEVVRAYGAVVVAAARVKTWERIVAVAKSESEIYEARLAARDTTEMDAKLVRVELARQSVALAEARADLTRALADLSRLAGTRFTDPPPPADPPAAARAPSGRDVPAVRALESEASYHARVRDRQAREAHSPFNFIVSVGRGDLGEARLGGGVSWYLPMFRRGQGEMARADASRARALALRDVAARTIAIAVAGLAAEREQVRRALEEITRTAEPAARAAVDAAVATQRAGKGDLLPVLTARRDLALLEARRLELMQREWNIVSDIVALTGDPS